MKEFTKIMVATDLHGSLDVGKKLVERFNEEYAEAFVIMGDFYYHGPRNPLPQGHGPMALCEALNKIADKIIAIRGNCDAHIDETISEFTFHPTYDVSVGGKKITFTHGHLFNEKCFPYDTDVLMFGHTHVNRVFDECGKIAVNLASASLPKENCPQSYAIVEDRKITIKTIGGTIIQEIEY